jgi:prepilin-type N-terminal cleavage/methylation domain-containing protein
MSIRKTSPQNGFSLLEVMVAIVVLSLGILGVATLMSQMGAGTTESRYMSAAAMLASQKLEDLNRYSANDPNVACANPTCGSLTADVPLYFDQVEMSSGIGNAASGLNSNDIVENFKTNGSYTQILHSPDGTISSQTTNGNPANASADMLVFDRRWLIEPNTPAFGVRRITVWVNLSSAANNKNSSFQATMVRP